MVAFPLEHEPIPLGKPAAGLGHVVRDDGAAPMGHGPISLHPGLQEPFSHPLALIIRAAGNAAKEHGQRPGPGKGVGQMAKLHFLIVEGSFQEPGKNLLAHREQIQESRHCLAVFYRQGGQGIGLVPAKRLLGRRNIAGIIVGPFDGIHLVEVRKGQALGQG